MFRTMRNRRFSVSPTSKVTSGRAVVFFAANPMAAGMTQAATSKAVAWPLQSEDPQTQSPTVSCRLRTAQRRCWRSPC